MTCPRCGTGTFTPTGTRRHIGDPDYPALSRVDNTTEICSGCGNQEAIDQHLQSLLRESTTLTKEKWQTK